MRDGDVITPAQGNVHALLLHARRRRRVIATATALLAASAGAGAVTAVLSAAGAPSRATQTTALAVGVAVAFALGARAWRHWTLARVAADIEHRAGTFDNLLVTAEEIAGGRLRTVSQPVRDAIFDAASTRLAATRDVRAIVPLLAAAIAIAATTLVIVRVPQPLAPVVPGTANDAPAAMLGEGDVSVTVTPPAYVRQQPTTTINPEVVTAVEGSRIRLETPASAGAAAWTDAAGGEITPLTRHDGRLVAEFDARASRAIVVTFTPEVGTTRSRLVALRVQPDHRPLVRIRAPGTDLVMAEARGQVAVEIDAHDDLAVAALTLRYTRVSGSGESFTFAQGDIPLRIARPNAGEWTGAATLALDALQLGDGDTLIYQAIAHDAKPGAEPGLSESYVIEIGRLSGLSSTGFALPDDRERQALSQQMLIIKTEKLHASRGAMPAEQAFEQSQMLALEQRSVRAEFVFMTGGDVQDEVAEAEHSHELAEGRFENEGQAELLAAIREMSRAEARLNAGDTEQALVFERAALRALQRAFDRRRYLLRTLPERTRIDPERRLSGDLADVGGLRAERVAVTDDTLLTTARTVLSALAAFDPQRDDAAVMAARVLAVDAGAEALQRAAAAIAASRDAATWQVAREAAERALIALVRAQVGAAGDVRLSRDPWAGWWADAQRQGQP